MFSICSMFSMFSIFSQPTSCSPIRGGRMEHTLVGNILELNIQEFDDEGVKDKVIDGRKSFC